MVLNLKSFFCVYYRIDFYFYINYILILVGFKIFNILLNKRESKW